VEGTRGRLWTATAGRRVSRLVSRLELRQRVGLQITFDSLALVGGLAAAQTGRFTFDVSELRDPGFWVIVLLAVCLLHFVGTALHLYLGRYRFGGFEEVLSILTSVTLTVIGVEIAVLAFGQPRPLPLSVPPLGGTVTLSIMFGVRYLYRLTEERLLRPAPEGAQALIVFGAGEGAEQVLAAMLRTPDSPYFPVALLDDDPRCWNLQLHGVRVRGGRDQIETVARATGASTLLVAIPSADAALLREVAGLAEAAGLAVKVLPRVADLLDGNVDVSDIREIDIADLLGRRQIRTDVAVAASYLAGRRVLVTGAGGSIGSELCRQLHAHQPTELIMLDRDESALRAVQLSLYGHTGMDDDCVVLGDLRDVDMITALFTERRPEVVFHAAALKHLPLLERFPGESVKTNVWGTLSVLEAAVASGVERFVNISTDKAADPSSVLGYSKRITERLTAYVAAEHGVPYVSVRFGNVLGSNGSVLTIFASQLAAGVPLTVTDPDVTRYFMTVQEAVELVLQAGALGSGGDALVLDMGEPVRIDDVARRLAARAEAKPGSQKIDIVYTGLGVGEKLHEALFGIAETDDRPHHPLISEVPVPPLDPRLVVELDPWVDDEKIRTALRELGRDGDLAALTTTLAHIPAQPTSPDSTAPRR